MRKRAQSEEVVKAFLIAILTVVILFAGYKGVVSIKDRICTAELVDFELSIKGLHKDLRPGTVNERTFSVPCGVDEVYFLDNPNIPLPEWFNDQPLIKDSIVSQSDKNVFLIRDEEVISSFSAGQLSMGYPHFTCVSPFNAEIDLLLEGKGRTVSITPACEQPECGYIPEVLDQAATREVLEETTTFAGCRGCVAPGRVNNELPRALEAQQNVEVFRRYDVCEDKTRVELIFKPKDGKTLKNFRFFESIPKECIADINDHLLSIQNLSGGSIMQIKADPLIMWHFDELDADQKVFYELWERLSADCSAKIRGAPLVRSVEEKTGPSVSDTIDHPVAETAKEELSQRREASRETRTRVQREEVITTPSTNPTSPTQEQTTQELTPDTNVQDTQPSPDNSPEPIQEQTDDQDTFEITSTPTTQAQEGAGYEYDVQTEDEEDVQYTLLTSPFGVSFNRFNGLLQWTPQETKSETFTVTARHSRTGEVATQTFTVEVEENTALACTPQFTFGCSDGDIHFFDSCGEVGQLKEECGFFERCNINECCIFCSSKSFTPPIQQRAHFEGGRR